MGSGVEKKNFAVSTLGARNGRILLVWGPQSSSINNVHFFLPKAGKTKLRKVA